MKYKTARLYLFTCKKYPLRQTSKCELHGISQEAYVYTLREACVLSGLVLKYVEQMLPRWAIVSREKQHLIS